jgi:recombination protein RecA
MKSEKKETTPDIEEAIKGLNKKYGSGTILKADDNPADIETISTGSFAIDYIFGCGGLPRGRLIEVYGQESSGKSTLCLFFASQIQKQKGKVVYIDAENAYDPSYAKGIGVETEKLIVSQPSTLEETMDTIRAFVETNAIDLIIVDSVAALVPRSELEGEEMLKDTMATQARLLGKALRILTGPISRSKTIVIFINQLRDKIGVFYGQKETTPGGKALKFFSSVRLSVTKGDKILGTKEEQIGNRLNITAVKNKVGFPWRRCSIDLYYGTGIDLSSDLFDTAVESNVIKKEGNTYSYDKIELGVGREKALDNLRKSPAETIKIIREATSKDVKEEK